MTLKPTRLHASLTNPGARQMICAVSLIDRRTGSALRVNGRPLFIMTSDPDGAARHLLDGRDPKIWQVRTDTVQTAAANAPARR